MHGTRKKSIWKENHDMTKLSDPITICGRTAKNRIVFLPCVTFSFRGDGDDYFGAQHLDHYTKAAEGGAGIVYVQGTNALGIQSDLKPSAALEGSGQWTPGSRRMLSRIADVIHSNGALAFIQLSWGGDRETDLNALTTGEIEQKQKCLLDAALLAGELGFDGIEFHYGHAFLLCKTIDSKANQRTDRFGGSIEARASLITEIIPEIKSKFGKSFIICFRMGAYLPDLETGLATARYLESSGADMFNITYSMAAPLPAPADFPLSDMAYGGSLVKPAVNVPVIGVGGTTTQEKAEALVSGNLTDMAGVARGILADPAFPRKILSGEPVNECVGCAKCFWYTDHTKCPARAGAV